MLSARVYTDIVRRIELALLIAGRAQDFSQTPFLSALRRAN